MPCFAKDLIPVALAHYAVRRHLYVELESSGRVRKTFVLHICGF